MSDSSKEIMFELKKKRKDIIFWIVLVLSAIVVYFTLSSGEFSFLMVLSSITQTASLTIIAIKVYTYQNSSGLSLNSMICYLIAITARLSSTLFYTGYLPSDSAGDWFYQLCEIASFFMCIINIFFITRLFSETSESDTDDAIDYKYLVVPALLLALLVHTGLNKNLITDVAWSFSMYLEGVSIFPQLHLFTKKGGQIEAYTSHYVSLQGLSRVLSLIFWWFTYDELNEENEDSFSFLHSYSGYFLIASQLIQLALMLDFYYHYFKSMYKGEQMRISEEIRI